MYACRVVICVCSEVGGLIGSRCSVLDVVVSVLLLVFFVMVVVV